MKLKQQIKDYFTLNRQEQRGVFVLLVLLGILLSTNLFLPWLLPDETGDFSAFEREIKEFDVFINQQEAIGISRKRSYPVSTKTFPLYFDTSHNSRKPARDNLVIELNSADTLSLQRLHGIGPAFARRIVKYRERLGGYISPSQLLEIFGMDTARFNNIRTHLAVEPDSVRKIDLNAVTFKALMSHPYFPYEVARPILICRDKRKKFRDVNELRDIPGIGDSVFNKIREYITVN